MQSRNNNKQIAKGLGMSDEMMERRVTMLEDDRVEMRRSISSIDKSLQQLATLAAHHEETRDGLGRAFKECDIVKERIRLIEVEIPALKDARADIRRATWIVITFVILGVMAVVVRT